MAIVSKLLKGIRVTRVTEVKLVIRVIEMIKVIIVINGIKAMLSTNHLSLINYQLPVRRDSQNQSIAFFCLSEGRNE